METHIYQANSGLRALFFVGAMFPFAACGAGAQYPGSYNHFQSSTTLSQTDLTRYDHLGHDLQKLSHDIKKLEQTPITRSDTVHMEIQRNSELMLERSPSRKNRIVALRSEARAERRELDRNLFNINFEGLWAILSFSGDSPAAEEELQEAREHLRRYCQIMKEIEDLTGETNAYADTWAARTKNVRYEARYAVHSSDSSVNASSHWGTHYSDPASSSSSQPKTHEESYFEWIKVPKVVGFDRNGNPVKEMRYDVILRKKIVKDND